MQCIKCNSDNTQRLELVYENGTQNIKTSSHSAGASIGGAFGVGGVHTSTTGVSRSTLAEKAAPPEKNTYRWQIIFMIVGYFCLGGGTALKIFGVLLMIACAYLLFDAIKFNAKRWPGLHQAWRESWLCHKCGNIYRLPH